MAARPSSALGRALRLASALLVAVAACAERPEPEGDVVARIGEGTLGYAEFQAYLETTLDEPASRLDSAALSSLFDQFLADRLIVALALERGLPAEVAEPRRAADFLLAAAGEPELDPVEIRAYYDAHRDRYTRPERIHLRQILVAEREEAEGAMAALDAGEDFVAVSARLSQDPRAELGGDQGWLGREDLPQMFAGVLDALAPGEHSDIVEADYGYHIFQVVARAPADVVPFDEAEPEIRRDLHRGRVDALLDGFVEEARNRFRVAVFRQNFPFEYQGRHAQSTD